MVINILVIPVSAAIFAMRFAQWHVMRGRELC